jgi:phosphoribosylformimino-5-aminoimidazole carboxamide ribotide isomerase
MMLIIPAIDLIDGKCVRLTEGDFSEKKTYNSDPLAVASIFKKSGAKRIHIIDLDGAKSGSSKNREIIKLIKKELGIEIETGGGIRTRDDAKELIDAGIDRLILGTVITEKLGEVKEWLKSFGADRFIAGIDVKDNVVKTKGWLEGSGLNPIAFGMELFLSGFTTAIYTDISKDGKLSGPNIEDAKNFAETTRLGVILSGGISSLNDIENAVNNIKSGLSGIIIGKAHYEGRIDIMSAIKKFQD